jgi:hypothetical protein
MNNREQIDDKFNVRETIERYFFAVDAKDKMSLVSCFSADAEAIYHWLTPEQKTLVVPGFVGCTNWWWLPRVR